VIDDGSTDGTSEMIMREFPRVHLLKGDGNLWWAGAMNEGINYVLKNFRYNEYDYVLTLNNDLEVPADYLTTLDHHADLNKKAIMGSVSVDITDPSHMEFCGIRWNEYTGKYFLKAKIYNHSYKDLKEKVKFIDSAMLPGRGTLIPIKVFSEIGLYDSQNFPQYAADEDFSLRARKKGWSLVIPTDVFVMSHITETGMDLGKARFSISSYKHIFFSIKSPLNLKIRYRWAMKNTRLKLFYFLLESIKLFLSVSVKMIKRKPSISKS
jgi:GT2 family glycosyltransferase